MTPDGVTRMKKFTGPSGWRDIFFSGEGVGCWRFSLAQAGLLGLILFLPAPVTSAKRCTPWWSCTVWSACTAGRQARSCNDLHGCATTRRPLEAQDCLLGPELITDLNPHDPDGGGQPTALPSPGAGCTPVWSCTAWSACVNSTWTRRCDDLNRCGTTAGQPAQVQSCVAAPAASACTSSWICTSWSACAASTQTRICTDAQACGTAAGKPKERQPCGTTTAAAPAIRPTAAVDLLAVVGPAPDRVPPVLSQVAVSGMTTTRASVSWSTSEPADSRVRYGSGGRFSAEVGEPSLTWRHTLVLDGLLPATSYQAQVVSRDAAGNEARVEPFTFQTLAVGVTPETTAPQLSVLAVAPAASGVAISWQTNEPATSVVEYGTSATDGRQASASVGTLTTQHAVILDDVRADTTYFIRVVSADALGNTVTSSRYTLVDPSSGAPTMTPAVGAVGSRTPSLPTPAAVRSGSAPFARLVVSQSNQLFVILPTGLRRALPNAAVAEQFGLSVAEATGLDESALARHPLAAPVVAGDRQLPEVVDTDGDLLSNGQESRLGTDPTQPDTDGDTYLDGAEVHNGYDPLSPRADAPPRPEVVRQTAGRFVLAQGRSVPLYYIEPTQHRRVPVLAEAGLWQLVRQHRLPVAANTVLRLPLAAPSPSSPAQADPRLEGQFALDLSQGKTYYVRDGVRRLLVPGQAYAVVRQLAVTLTPLDVATIPYQPLGPDE